MQLSPNKYILLQLVKANLMYIYNFIELDYITCQNSLPHCIICMPVQKLCGFGTRPSANARYTPNIEQGATLIVYVVVVLYKVDGWKLQHVKNFGGEYMCSRGHL